MVMVYHLICTKIYSINDNSSIYITKQTFLPQILQQITDLKDLPTTIHH